MSSKAKTGTSKRSRSNNTAEAANEVCALCCQPIVERKDDALLCEGEESCNKWMHRYCAGVSVKHYESLGESPLPFNCSICTQRKQAIVINELKSTIAVLRAEIVELSAAVRRCQAHQQTGAYPNDERMKWTEVATRRSRKQPTQWKNHANGTRSGATASSTTAATTSATTSTPTIAVTAAGTKVHVEKASVQKMPRVKVPGVRRVWGTRRGTSTTVVMQTVRQLTQLDSKK